MGMSMPPPPPFDITPGVGMEVNQSSNQVTQRDRMEQDDMLAAQIYCSSVAGRTPKAKSLVQQKVSTENSCNTCIGRADSLLSAAVQKFDVIDTMCTQVSSTLPEETQTLLVELRTSVLASRHKVESAVALKKTSLAGKKAEIARATEIQTLIHFAKEAADEVKELAKSNIFKEYNTAVAGWKTELVQLQRGPSRGAASDVNETVPDVVQHLTAFCSGIVDRRGSLYEAKAGIRGHVAKIPGALLVPLQKQATFKKAVKDLKKHVTTRDYRTSTLSQKDDGKLYKLLRTHMDAAAFQRFVIPKESVMLDEKVCRLQWYAQRESSVICGMNTFAAMEGRLIMDGECHWIGIACDQVPGDSLRDKRAVILGMAEGDLKTLIETHGWSLSAAAGDIMIAPSGFVCCVVAETTVYGMRWTIAADDADALRCKTGLAEIMAAYPETKQPSTGLSMFHDHLSRSM